MVGRFLSFSMGQSEQTPGFELLKNEKQNNNKICFFRKRVLKIKKFANES